MAKKSKSKKIKKNSPTKPDKRGIIHNPILFDEFIKFMSTPEPLRKKECGYKTMTDFARYNKISRDTLHEWKKRPEYEKERQIYLKKWMKDKTPNAIQAMYKTILKEGKASEVKLWLEYGEEWIPGMVLHTPEMVAAIRERTNLVRELVKQEKAKTKKI